MSNCFIHYTLYIILHCMSEFEQNRRIRRILLSPVVLVLLAILLFFLARGVWNIYVKDRASISELNSSKERLAKLQSRQETLVVSTEKLSTESGVEYEIRDRLQMARAGERQIVIVDSPGTANPTISPPKNFLQKIWDFFTIR